MESLGEFALEGRKGVLAKYRLKGIKWIEKFGRDHWLNTENEMDGKMIDWSEPLENGSE
jgi:hypothetical protein